MSLAVVKVDQHAGRTRGLLICVGVLAVVCLLSVTLGTRTIGPGTVWDAFAHYRDTDDQAIVRDLRVPRTALGLLAGVSFGLSGAVIQAVTRNPLADTQILGVHAGAGLFVVFAVGVLGLTDLSRYLWFGFAGVAVALVLVPARRDRAGRRHPDPADPVRGGARRGARRPVHRDPAGAATGVRLPAVLGRRLAGRPLAVATTILPFVLAGTVLALVVARELNAVALGDDLARTLGAGIARTRLLALVSVMLLAGAATAAVGPIGFVGLMVPHVVRWIVGPDQRWIFGYTVVCGPILLLLADIVGRLVVRPGELRVGIVTRGDSHAGRHVRVSDLGPSHAPGVAGRRARGRAGGHPPGFFHKRAEEDVRIDWTWSAEEPDRLVRAQSAPYPQAFCFHRDRRLEIVAAGVSEAVYGGTPGRIFYREGEGVAVVAGADAHRPRPAQALRECLCSSHRK